MSRAKVHGNRTIGRRPNILPKSDYKQYLQELHDDFKGICGYCGKSFMVTRNTFEIDHFVPKKYAPARRNDYSNLVYSCWLCNRKKGGKWPTEDGSLTHNGLLGFADPATDEYHEHLKREHSGEIVSDSPVGNYMVKTFQFDLRPLREIWKVMRLYDYQGELLEICKDKNILSQRGSELIEVTEIIREIQELMAKTKE